MGHTFWWWWLRRWLLLSCLVDVDLDDKSRPPINDGSKDAQSDEKTENNVYTMSEIVWPRAMNEDTTLWFVDGMPERGVLGRGTWQATTGISMTSPSALSGYPATCELNEFVTTVPTNERGCKS